MKSRDKKAAVICLITFIIAVIILVSVIINSKKSYSFEYGFGIICEDEFPHIDPGFTFELVPDLTYYELQKEIQAIETIPSDSVPEYGEGVLITLDGLFSKKQFLLLYSPQEKAYYLYKNKNWYLVADLGTVQNTISDLLYWGVPCGFRYELYEEHLFMPRSHFILFDDSIWTENVNYYKNRDFKYCRENEIENQLDAFSLAKKELNFEEAVGTWCFDPDEELFEITLVSKNGKTTDKNEMKNSIYSVIISKSGSIREIYSFHPCGVPDYNLFDYTSKEYPDLGERGVLLS